MLNGWKTYLGLTLAAIPLIISAAMAGDWPLVGTLFGGWLAAVGAAHKAAKIAEATSTTVTKVTRPGPNTSTSVVTTTPALLLVFALGLGTLTGCAGLQPAGGSPASAGAPQPATNLAQTARDQAAVPGQAYGGHVNWYFASQGAPAIQQRILALAEAGNWTPEQLAAALASTNGAPHTVAITTTNVQGGNADNAGAGTGGASGAFDAGGDISR